MRPRCCPKSQNPSLLWCQTNVISWIQFARVIGSGHYCTWSKVMTGGLSRGLLCPNAKSWFNCMGNSVCTIENPAQCVSRRKPNYQWKLHPDNTISTKRQFMCPFMSCCAVVFFQGLPIYFSEASHSPSASYSSESCTTTTATAEVQTCSSLDVCDDEQSPWKQETKMFIYRDKNPTRGSKLLFSVVHGSDTKMTRFLFWVQDVTTSALNLQCICIKRLN